MSDSLITSVTTVAVAIVGVAIIAVLVSRNSNTAGVVQAGGSAFAQMLSAAVSPVSGASGFGSFTGGGAGLPNLMM